MAVKQSFHGGLVFVRADGVECCFAFQEAFYPYAFVGDFDPIAGLDGGPGGRPDCWGWEG